MIRRVLLRLSYTITPNQFERDHWDVRSFQTCGFDSRCPGAKSPCQCKCSTQMRKRELSERMSRRSFRFEKSRWPRLPGRYLIKFHFCWSKYANRTFLQYTWTLGKLYRWIVKKLTDSRTMRSTMTASMIMTKELWSTSLLATTKVQNPVSGKGDGFNYAFVTVGMTDKMMNATKNEWSEMQKKDICKYITKYRFIKYLFLKKIFFQESDRSRRLSPWLSRLGLHWAKGPRQAWGV